MFDWLTLPYSVLLFAALMIVIDLLLRTEFLTYLGWLLIASVVFYLVEAPLVIRLCVSFAVIIVLAGLHYVVWRSLISAVGERFAPSQEGKFGLASLVGEVGVVVQAGDRLMVRVLGDLYPISSSTVSPGDVVEVTSFQDGCAAVSLRIGS